jgi:hypothetical protein
MEERVGQWDGPRTGSLTGRRGGAEEPCGARGLLQGGGEAGELSKHVAQVKR